MKKPDITTVSVEDDATDKCDDADEKCDTDETDEKDRDNISEEERRAAELLNCFYLNDGNKALAAEKQLILF